MDAVGIIVPIVGLVVAIVVVGGVFFTLYKVFGGMKRANQERERLLREGIQASARVLGVQMGGMTMTVGVHRHLQLQISLEVQPAGRPPYQTTLTTMISELQLPQIQPGVMLTIRYDAQNPSKVALEGVGAAQPAQMGAAQPAQMGGAYGQPAAYGQPNPQAQAYAQPGQYPGAQGYGGAPQAAAYAPGGYGMGGPGGPPGMGAMVPIQGVPGMPKGAKIGLIIGVLGAVVGIGAAVVVVAVNVLGVGTGDATEGSGVCAQAARCCQTIGGPATACENYGRVGVPESACQTALDGYKTAAQAQGKTCQ